MTVKFVWLAGVLTLTLLVIIETSALNETRIKKEDYQRLKTYDVKGKGKKLKETKIKPIFKKCHDGEHCSIVDESDETHKDRIKRNGSETLNELEDGKKNYKKLKLARTLSGFKKWTNKELSSDPNGDEFARKKINPRHVSYFTNNEERTSRSERYAVTRNFKDDKSEYYAQRKAVMDRFYARQREIAEKYAKKISTTPKYIYRYDLDKETDKNNLFVKIKTDNTGQNETGNAVNSTSYDLETTTFATSTTTTTTTTTTQEQVTEMTTVANRISRSNQDQVDEDSYDEEGDDVEYREDNNQNIEDWEADDRRSDTLKYGTCSGKLVYQHNLIIAVHKSLLSEVDLTTSVEGPYCVTCIRVVPLNNNRGEVTWEANRRQDGSFSTVKLRVKGINDGELSLSVKVWAVNKMFNTCV